MIDTSASLSDYDDCFPQSESMSFGEKAEFTSRTNYFSTLDACEVLFPILKSHAR